MAEQSTQTDATATQAHSQTNGLTDSGEETTIVLSAEEPAANTTQTLVQTTTTEPAQTDLERQNERLRQQVNGWEQQSRRNMDERNALAERIARLEGSIAATQVKETPATAQTRTLALKTALNKWINGDDSEIDNVERLLSQPTTTQQPVLKPEDIDARVNSHLQTLMTTGQALAWVGDRHPEMRDKTDPVYANIFENYEAYASDPGYAMLFPQDARFNASIPSPDGMRNKQMDVRIVNDLAGRLKLARGTTNSVQQGREEERRASSVGNVGGSNGNTTRTNSERAVEAWDLCNDKERDEIRNMIMSKAVPPGWPKTERGIAKKLYDLASPAEKQQMQSSFRRSARGVN